MQKYIFYKTDLTRDILVSSELILRTVYLTLHFSSFLNAYVRDHRAPAEALAGMGYHLLLEKPMAVTEVDCVESNII